MRTCILEEFRIERHGWVVIAQSATGVVPRPLSSMRLGRTLVVSDIDFNSSRYSHLLYVTLRWYGTQRSQRSPSGHEMYIIELLLMTPSFRRGAFAIKRRPAEVGYHVRPTGSGRIGPAATGESCSTYVMQFSI